jgi:hypothetical protein
LQGSFGAPIQGGIHARKLRRRELAKVASPATLSIVGTPTIGEERLKQATRRLAHAEISTRFLYGTEDAVYQIEGA